MSVPGQKDKFTPELRILVASLLSFGVIILWARFFGPKPQVPPPQANRPAVTAPATPGPATSPAANTPQAVAAPATIAPAKPERVLDVVHPDASQQTGGWPFALVLDDEQLQNAANAGLYQISSDSTNLHAPADLDLTWSDGHLEVTKHFHFDHTYVVRVETSVKLNGNPIKAGLGWLGGFGDLTVTNPAPVETVTTYYSEGGKITNFAHKKLEGPDKWGPGVWQGGKDFVGIEDRYFTAAFLPPNGAAPGTLETRYWKAFHTVKAADGQETPEPVPQVAV